ncbi:MAG TPA: GAF domain-containing protein, partial [Abditibacterium sp.]
MPLESGIAARRLRYLSQVGLALSAERDIENLLEMILTTSRELTAADGGTLYILEKDARGKKSLFFRASQNDSIIVPTNLSFAVSSDSLAGYAALSGEILRFDDVYHLSPREPYKFNPKFDAENNYRTQSVLVVPLKDHNREVIGVLQLINRKRRREVLLRDPVTVEQEVIPFDDEMTELAATLASQAAVALNNTLLLREIEALFESFVVAASSAIEDRDPGTSGHSRRVTNLTLALARAVSEDRD